MKYLYIFSHSPYGDSLAREAIDMALATAAFDQEVQIVFQGDALYQLLHNQNTEQLQRKNVGKSLASLPLFDIDALYLLQDDLNNKGLKPEDLLLDCKSIDLAEYKTLIADADKVMSF